MIRRTLGEKSLTDNGLANVHISDFHERTFARHFLNYTGIFGILQNPASPGDWQLTLTAGTIGSFAIGDTIFIRQNGVEEADYFRITNLVGQVISLNYPIRNNYVPGFPTTIEKVYDDMAMANLTDTASVSTPVIFELRPYNDLIVHITQINIQIDHSLPGSDDKFGSITELANGILIYEIKEITKNIGIFRNNGNFRKFMGANNLVYNDRAGASAYTTAVEWRMKQINDTIVNINGMHGDLIKINLQDNLEALERMEVVGIGHFEEN